MTRFATYAASWYSLANSFCEGVAHGYELNQNDSRLGAVRSIITSVRESQLTGNFIGAVTVKVASRRFVASSTRITNPIELGKLRIADFVKVWFVLYNFIRTNGLISH